MRRPSLSFDRYYKTHQEIRQAVADGVAPTIAEWVKNVVQLYREEKERQDAEREAFEERQREAFEERKREHLQWREKLATNRSMREPGRDVKIAVIEAFTWAFLDAHGFSAPDDLQVEFDSDDIGEGEVKSDTQFLAQWVEDGPDLKTDGVVRWRCADLRIATTRMAWPGSRTGPGLGVSLV